MPRLALKSLKMQSNKKSFSVFRSWNSVCISNCGYQFRNHPSRMDTEREDADDHGADHHGEP